MWAFDDEALFTSSETHVDASSRGAASPMRAAFVPEERIRRSRDACKSGTCAQGQRGDDARRDCRGGATRQLPREASCRGRADSDSR
ncbi:hypothetical protein ACFPRL_03355 [Pseudoclavibacter helvolus]